MKAEDAIPEWGHLSPTARAFLLELALLFHQRVDSQVRFTAKNGGVRDVRITVDLNKVRVEPRLTGGSCMP